MTKRNKRRRGLKGLPAPGKNKAILEPIEMKGGTAPCKAEGLRIGVIKCQQQG